MCLFFSYYGKVARVSNFVTSAPVSGDALDWLLNCLMEYLEGLCVKVSTADEFGLFVVFSCPLFFHSSKSWFFLSCSSKSASNLNTQRSYLPLCPVLFLCIPFLPQDLILLPSPML